MFTCVSLNVYVHIHVRILYPNDIEVFSRLAKTVGFIGKALWTHARGATLIVGLQDASMSRA